MSKRSQTPGEKLAFNFLGLIVGGFFIVCSIGMIVTGKSGRHGVFSTPQNDPLGFWSGVVICCVLGVLVLVYSLRGIIKASDDETL